MGNPADGSLGGACRANDPKCDGNLQCTGNVCACPGYVLDTSASSRSCIADNTQLCVGDTTGSTPFYYLDHYQWGPSPPAGTPVTPAPASASACAATCFNDKNSYDAASWTPGVAAAVTGASTTSAVCTCFKISDKDPQCLSQVPLGANPATTTLISKEWLPSKVQGAICNAKP